MVIIIMGAAGAGKTTVGRALAETLGWRFVDGDDLHPPANVKKMAAGEALTDRDRAPWLDAVRQTIADAIRRRQPLVVACSALKQRYRDRLTDGFDSILFVYLKLSPALLLERLAKRHGHFAGPGLLESQLATLEEPVDGLVVDASAAPADIVRRITEELRTRRM